MKWQTTFESTHTVYTCANSNYISSDWQLANTFLTFCILLGILTKVQSDDRLKFFTSWAVLVSKTSNPCLSMSHFWSFDALCAPPPCFATKTLMLLHKSPSSYALKNMNFLSTVRNHLYLGTCTLSTRHIYATIRNNNDYRFSSQLLCVYLFRQIIYLSHILVYFITRPP